MKQVEFAPEFQFLFEPHRYKVVHGGRGKGASWSFARALLVIGAKRKIRVLCARQTQRSIADSVHTLLRDQVKEMGLSGQYVVQQATILGANGTEFIFAGLQHNISNIKSIEACDICWIEEAQNVTRESWETLIPTIRKDGSEIWVSFNAILETDDTYLRFVVNKLPEGAVVKKLTYRDNPWFPDTLRAEMELLKATDEKAYQHVWEGDCKSSVEGAIYAEEIKLAEAEGRICLVARDRTKPVDTIWDLGYGDKTAIWFVQAYDGWYHFVDYLEDNGRTIEWYLIQLQQRGYLYGTYWVPHDALDVMLHAKLGGDRTRSIEMIMREAGCKVRLVPKMRVRDGINAGRTIFPQCRFDSKNCYEGLRALRMYQWGPQSSDGRTPREPLHDAASHGADAFRGAALVLKQPKLETVKKPIVMPVHTGTYAPFG